MLNAAAMNAALILWLFWPPQPVPSAEELIAKIARSGRVTEALSPCDKLKDPQHQVAPGMPPLLAFRYFEGAERHRFGKLDLMVDDAGH